MVAKSAQKHNGAPKFKPIESPYLHCDSNGFGLGAVFNDCMEARGFWFGPDKLQHITFKELKAVINSLDLSPPD